MALNYVAFPGECINSESLIVHEPNPKRGLFLHVRYTSLGTKISWYHLKGYIPGIVNLLVDMLADGVLSCYRVAMATRLKF